MAYNRKQEMQIQILIGDTWLIECNDFTTCPKIKFTIKTYNFVL